MSDSDPKGYYAKLGLNSGASADDIKAAYRQLVKSVHPDTNPIQHGDATWFKELTEAYNVLGNAERRLEYDIEMQTTKLPAIVNSDEAIDPFRDIMVSAADAVGGRAAHEKSAADGRIRKWVAIIIGLAFAALVCVIVFLFFVRSIAPQILNPGAVFSDCYACPSMIVIPTGSFIMGSPPDDTGESKWSNPAHLVSINRTIAVGRFLVTNYQYASFLTAMMDRGIHDQRWAETDQTASRSHLLWRGRQVISEAGFESHPVTRVTWQGAKAYVQWISAKTGKSYRLLSEAEWEYAARAGTQTKFYFGDDVLKACEYANTADYTFTQHHTNAGGVRCTDGYSETSPVGAFKPNTFGLYDMIGNVWEWVEDCWHAGYDGAPVDGSPWLSGENCSKRVLRGQSFNFVNWGEGVAVRSQWDANGLLPSIGFRVARDISQ